MSLHAHLSPEAVARLEAQKRRFTVSSLLIAALVVVLIGLVLSLFLLPVTQQPKADFVAFTPIDIEPPKPEDPVVREKPMPKTNPTPPMHRPVKVINAPVPTNIVVPDTPFDTTQPSLDIGNSLDIGDSIGFDPLSNDFNPLPPDDVISKRCSKQDRMKRLRETGGPVEAEAAVVRSLDWLQRTQNADGSWGDQYQSAMTGFAILAYLGHCETPQSPKYGDTVTKGLTYLVNLGMKNDGKLTVLPDTSIQWVYEHAISTYALAEAQTFSKLLNKPFPNLERVTKKAGEIILDGQADSGGWNYRYANNATEGDNSVGFWQIQALKACKHTGIWADAKFNRASRNAVRFLERVQGQNGAIGYRTDPARSPQLTGGGVLCLQMWGEGDSDAVKKGVEWIRNNTQFEWGKPSANLYYHYYNAQAMINAGGEDWKWYNELFSTKLLEAQKEDGSWSQRMQHGPINDHMATCLATFMLEVYYRFLPGTNQ